MFDAHLLGNGLRNFGPDLIAIVITSQWGSLIATTSAKDSRRLFRPIAHPSLGVFKSPQRHPVSLPESGIRNFDRGRDRLFFRPTAHENPGQSMTGDYCCVWHNFCA